MAIAELNPTDKGKKNFDWSVRAKVMARDKLVADYQAVAAVGVAEWALASLFNIGEAYNNSIDKLLHAPIPDKIPGYKLSQEDKQLLRQKLKEMAQPIEALAVEAYKLCVTKANELGVYTHWSVRALDRLQKLRPLAYPEIEEHLPKIAMTPAIEVQRNGLVIEDSGVLKPITVKWPQPALAQATPAVAAPIPQAAPPPKVQATEPAPVVAPEDGVPSPVEE